MTNYINVLVDGGNSFRNESFKKMDYRENALYKLIKHIQDIILTKGLKALVLPAGYFCVKDKKDINKLALKVSKKISSLNCKFKVIYGIDLIERSSKRAQESKNGKLSFYGFVSQPGKSKPVKLQQVSATSIAGRDPKIEKLWGKRSVRIPNSSEALLICGESWSTILLEKVKKAAPKILIVIAHQNVKMNKNYKGYGKLSWHLNLGKFRSKTGIPVILSEHTRSPNRHKYAWPANRTKNIELPSELSRLFTAKLTRV